MPEAHRPHALAIYANSVVSKLALIESQQRGDAPG